MSGLSDLSQRDRRALELLAVAALALSSATAISLSAPAENRRRDRFGSAGRAAFEQPAPDCRGAAGQGSHAQRSGSGTRRSRESHRSCRHRSASPGQTPRSGAARRHRQWHRNPRRRFPARPRPFGDIYGEVFAEVTFNCRIDQFVNFFADLSREPGLDGAVRSEHEPHRRSRTKDVSRCAWCSPAWCRRNSCRRRKDTAYEAPARLEFPAGCLRDGRYLRIAARVDGNPRATGSRAVAQAQAPKVGVPPPPVKPAPFQAINYNDVAQKMLFSKDRNPNIPPPAPTARRRRRPPPMPALPHLYGVLGLPDGAVAIMSEKAGTPQKKVRVGDSVGEFKIAKSNNGTHHAPVER